MFSSIFLLGTSSANLASLSNDVFESADEDDLVTPNGGRERPLWHGKSDCAVLVLRINDSYSTYV
jgi:hypothetical protein